MVLLEMELLLIKGNNSNISKILTKYNHKRQGDEIHL